MIFLMESAKREELIRHSNSLSIIHSAFFLLERLQCKDLERFFKGGKMDHAKEQVNFPSHHLLLMVQVMRGKMNLK